MSEVGFLPDFFARRLSLSFVPPFDGLMIAREDWFVIKLVVEYGLIIHLPGCVTFRGGRHAIISAFFGCIRKLFHSQLLDLERYIPCMAVQD